jgi:hypothetical protein
MALLPLFQQIYYGLCRVVEVAVTSGLLSLETASTSCRSTIVSNFFAVFLHCFPRDTRQDGYWRVKAFAYHSAPDVEQGGEMRMGYENHG